MQQKNDSPAPEIKLQCCQGNSPPEYVVDGWKRFLSFPRQAKDSFGDILRPALLDPSNPESKKRVQLFCRDQGLAEEDVVAAVRCCDFLLRQASMLDLESDALSQDLVTLSEGESQSTETVLSKYLSITANLRKQIILGSLADHGKVLVGLDWRVDNVAASDRGARLNTTVVLLTLRYREGNRVERITLQLTPENVQKFKRFCDRFTD